MELRRSSHYDGFQINSEKDIKSVFQVDYYLAHWSWSVMRSLEKFWKATLFVLYFQDTGCLVRCPFCYLCTGLFQKKNPNNGVEDILFWKPWSFSLFYFNLGNSRQNKTQPLDIPRNCVRSLGNSNTKNRPLKFPHYFFLVTLWIFHFVFN